MKAFAVILTLYAITVPHPLLLVLLAFGLWQWGRAREARRACTQ